MAAQATLELLLLAALLLPAQGETHPRPTVVPASASTSNVTASLPLPGVELRASALWPGPRVLLTLLAPLAPLALWPGHQ